MLQNNSKNRACQGRLLVACEFSGIVRDAFRAAGWDACSCDILPSEQPGPHYQGDVRDILGESWDMLIAHPPCTYLASSGARYWATRWAFQLEALAFARMLLLVPHIHRVALENPISAINSHLWKPSQIIQPWQFGHGETKATCLWLKNLPLLTPTNIVAGRVERVYKMGPSSNRWRERSRTYPGIAAAMALQWGSLS